MDTQNIIDAINEIDGICAQMDVDKEWIEIGITDDSAERCTVDEAIHDKIGDIYNELKFEMSCECDGVAFYSV